MQKDFGLAQLHQLRGRIGRGGYESYCILKLMTKGKIALERAKIMKETSNGFIISEKDLELRGKENKEKDENRELKKKVLEMIDIVL